MRVPSLALTTAFAMTLAGIPDAGAADAERGRIIYEAKCGGCHAESVHGRDKRMAADFEGVRGWVRRWSANLGLKWTDDEVNDVAAHLNAAYYGFRCPPAYCTVTGDRARKGTRLALDGVPR